MFIMHKKLFNVIQKMFIMYLKIVLLVFKNVNRVF